MAWIESNQELGRHPKTKKLARLISSSLPEAVGYLHYLWWWALDFAQDGNLIKYEAADIADAVLWKGEPTDLVNALIDAGFLEINQSGGWSIHDWHDYAGLLIDKRRKDAERKRISRQNIKEISCTLGDFEEMSNGCPMDGAGNPTVPNPTVPNPTVSNSEFSTVNNSKNEDKKHSKTKKPVKEKNMEKHEEISKTIIPKVTPEDVVNTYNSICVDNPKVKLITMSRKDKINIRLKEDFFRNNYSRVFEIVAKTDFLIGKNDTGWKADFDWIIDNDKNYVKILEGKYAGSNTKNKRSNAYINPGQKEFSAENLEKFYAN